MANINIDGVNVDTGSLTRQLEEQGFDVSIHKVRGVEKRVVGFYNASYLEIHPYSEQVAQIYFGVGAYSGNNKDKTYTMTRRAIDQLISELNKVKAELA